MDSFTRTQILGAFRGTSTPSRRLDETLDMLTLSNFEAGEFSGWIAALAEVLDPEARTLLAGKAIRTCIDRRIRSFVPMGLNGIVAVLSQKECETVRKGLEEYYKKHRQWKKTSRSIFSLRKREKEKPSDQETIYNESVRILKEGEWLKKERD